MTAAPAAKRSRKAIFALSDANGRWSLIAPDGRPFLSLGVVHVSTFQKSALFQSAFGRDWRRAGEKVVADLRDWGFNSLGYQHPQELRAALPFIVDLYLGEIAYWMPRTRYPDVFSSAFAGPANEIIRRACIDAKASPNLIGYYWTDTPRWDLEIARRLTGDDWVSALRRLPARSPGKQRYVQFLREEHQSRPANFAQAYGGDLNEALVERDFSKLNLDHPTVKRDDRSFLRLIAREYYRVAGEAMQRHDRRRLVFGDRYMLRDLPREVLEEALPWIDVLSIQPYAKNFDHQAFDYLHRVSRKPILICDHQISFPTRRFPQTGWEQCSTEAEAGRAYDEYLSAAFDRPYIIGYHRCHYVDEFVPAREFLMQGLIQEDGTPYEAMVAATRRANRMILSRFGNCL